jgi:excinuclease ABC subunit A
VDAGRCETCKGEGSINVEMVFMADVQLPCETCNGKRFKKELLKLHLLGKYSRYLDDDD